MNEPTRRRPVAPRSGALRRIRIPNPFSDMPGVDGPPEGFTPNGPGLLDLRRAAGLTQMQLAIAAGTTPSAISDWERGHKMPRARFLRPLAEAFGVSVDQLLIAIDDTRLERA